MATQKTVVVDIKADGTTVVEANNFKGVGCKDATKQIELALAGNAPDNADKKFKPDYYATNPGSNTLKG